MTSPDNAEAAAATDPPYKELEQLLLQRIAASKPPEPPAAAGIVQRSPDACGAAETGDPSRCISLSASAVLHAQRLELATFARTRSFLYRYNTAPAGLLWRRELGTPAQVREFLLGSDRSASRDYTSNADEDEPSQGWWYWHRNGRRSPGADRLLHKLYVSPTCELTGLAFRASVDVLFSHEVLSFKVGCSAHGLLRPDKFVVYFSDLDRLYDVADALGRRLHGVSAQGVPFTIPLGSGGLLSRGIDPPKPASTGRPWSWRALVTARIAKWLHATGGGTAGGRIQPHRPSSASTIRSDHANPSA